MSDSVSMMPEHPPVTDWVHDFDHTDPNWTENPTAEAASPVVATREKPRTATKNRHDPLQTLRPENC